MSTLVESALADAIARAWDVRQALHEDPSTDAYRLFHGYSEGCPGLEIDRYGDWLVLLSKGCSLEHMEEARELVCERLPQSSIVSKLRGQPPVIVKGERTDEVVVRESERFYRVEPWIASNPGLYLDARLARTWLRENSEGRRVLNLFSCAGSLGVAAMAGGAAAITHVDGQKRALKRCAANHKANGQRVDSRDLICMDVPRYLRSKAARARGFGGIIIDAPPIPKHLRDGRKGLTAIELSREATPLLSEGGWLLCFFHHDIRDWDELESAVIEGSEVPVETFWRGQSGDDFPEEDARRSLRLSAFRRV